MRFCESAAFEASQIVQTCRPVGRRMELDGTGAEEDCAMQCIDHVLLMIEALEKAKRLICLLRKVRATKGKRHCRELGEWMIGGLGFMPQWALVWLQSMEWAEKGSVRCSAPCQ